MIERLRDSINRLEDRSIKNISDKFGIAQAHLVEIEKYYALKIILEDSIERH